MISERLTGRPAMIGGGLVLVATVWIVRFWMSHPQIGTEEHVFQTVDALFTALNSRDSKRLADCEQRLHDYQEDGSLPDAAANSLESIIRQARSGQWEPSAHRLYDFMLAQRRGS